MRDLLSPAGLRSIQNLASLPSVLIFDLDGTLAPLVPHFADAKVPLRTAMQLVNLLRLWPIAVVTGRSVKDAQGRLGFTPDYLFGNHGAERVDQPAFASLSSGLNTFRHFLKLHAVVMTARKVVFEDKGLSLALHYRQSHNPAETCAWLHELLNSLHADVAITDGHKVINVLQLQAPDKGDALKIIMQESRAVSALVVGDDANDEAAFVAAPELAVTVRIGSKATYSRAKFRLASQHQVDWLLEFLLTKKARSKNLLPKCNDCEFR